MITVIGSYVSPFVRKVLACLGFEGATTAASTRITPYQATTGFDELSPLRHVTVLIDHR